MAVLSDHLLSDHLHTTLMVLQVSWMWDNLLKVKSFKDHAHLMHRSQQATYVSIILEGTVSVMFDAHKQMIKGEGGYCISISTWHLSSASQ